jgi:hypothetical protein
MTSPKFLPDVSASSDTQLTGGVSRSAGPFSSHSATTHGKADTAPGRNSCPPRPAPARLNLPQLVSQEQLDRETRRERIIWLVQDVIGGVALLVMLGVALAL